MGSASSFKEGADFLVTPTSSLALLFGTIGLGAF